MTSTDHIPGEGRIGPIIASGEIPGPIYSHDLGCHNPTRDIRGLQHNRGSYRASFITSCHLGSQRTPRMSPSNKKIHAGHIGPLHSNMSWYGPISMVSGPLHSNIRANMHIGPSYSHQSVSGANHWSEGYNPPQSLIWPSREPLGSPQGSRPLGAATSLQTAPRTRANDSGL